MLIKKRTLFFLGLMVVNRIIGSSSDGGYKDKSNSLKLPSFVNVLEVKSSTDGRVRFSVPVMKNNMMLAKHLIKQVKNIPVIKRCSVNTSIATVIVEYDSSVVDAHTVEGALIKILGIDNLLEEGRISNLRLRTKEFIDAINNGIYDYSNGILDFKSVVLIGFLALALYDFRVLGRRRIPDYATLLWWSSSLV